MRKPELLQTFPREFTVDYWFIVISLCTKKKMYGHHIMTQCDKTHFPWLIVHLHVSSHAHKHKQQNPNWVGEVMF